MKKVDLVVGEEYAIVKDNRYGTRVQRVKLLDKDYEYTTRGRYGAGWSSRGNQTTGLLVQLLSRDSGEPLDRTDTFRPNQITGPWSEYEEKYREMERQKEAERRKRDEFYDRLVAINFIAQEKLVHVQSGDPHKGTVVVPIEWVEEYLGIGGE